MFAEDDVNSTQSHRTFRTRLASYCLPYPEVCTKELSSFDQALFTRRLSITSAENCEEVPNKRHGRRFCPASQQLGSLFLQGAHNSMSAGFRRFQKAEGQQCSSDQSFRVIRRHSDKPDQQAICCGPLVSSPTTLACSIRYSSLQQGCC